MTVFREGMTAQQKIDGATKLLRAAGWTCIPSPGQSSAEVLAAEIASDVFPWVPDQTIEKLIGIRGAVQRRLECAEGRELARRIGEQR